MDWEEIEYRFFVGLTCGLSLAALIMFTISLTMIGTA